MPVHSKASLPSISLYGHVDEAESVRKQALAVQGSWATHSMLG